MTDTIIIIIIIVNKEQKGFKLSSSGLIKMGSMPVTNHRKGK